jgi:hypothetical protein
LTTDKANQREGYLAFEIHLTLVSLLNYVKIFKTQINEDWQDTLSSYFMKSLVLYERSYNHMKKLQFVIFAFSLTLGATQSQAARTEITASCQFVFDYTGTSYSLEAENIPKNASYIQFNNVDPNIPDSPDLNIAGNVFAPFSPTIVTINYPNPAITVLAFSKRGKLLSSSSNFVYCGF